MGPTTDSREERMARSLQDRLNSAAGQGSAAVTGAVRAWAGAAQQVTRSMLDPVVVVEGTFDAAEQLLRAQREVALTVLRLARGDRR
jgi:hypothetical protein